MIMLYLLCLLMVDILHSVDSARYARFSADYVTDIGSFASADTRNVVYLGAKNKIMKLHFATRVFVPQFEVLSSRCRLGDMGCADYTQHVLLADGSIFNVKENTVLVTCGTNGGKPRCVLRVLGLLMNIKEVHALNHVATINPNLKSLATVEGSALYYASYLTNDKSHAIIGQYTSYGTLTSKIDPHWFKEAEFVALQPIDDHVYVFFKEMSLGAQPMLTSRVARVCQKDKGGNKLILRNHFATFTKATITCKSPSSIAGVPDYTYNFIDGIAIPAAALEQRHSKDRMMYAIFSNIPNGPCYTSAICAYNMKDMDKTFKTDEFVKVEHGQETVHTVKSVSDTCEQPRSLYDAHLYNLLKEPLIQTGSTPSYEARCRKYTAIAADRVNNIDVLFIATDDDYFFKMAINKGKGYLVDQFRIRKEKHSIEKIVKLHGENYVLASSPSFLLRIPVAQCRRFNDCNSCVESRDPYCGWCPVYNKCVATISCPKPVTNHNDELDSDNLCYPYQHLLDNNTRRVRMKKIKKRRRLK